MRPALRSLGLFAVVASTSCGLFSKEDTAADAPVASDVIAGCEPTDGPPDDLRCTGLFTDVATKVVSPSAREFAPAVPFWSDGAEKHRWIELPAGQKIDTSAPDQWRFPVGTKAWKEFRVGGRRIETRFFMKVRDDRWLQAAYVWSADELEAKRVEGAKVDVNGAAYEVPNSSECSDCHKGRVDRLLGFEAVSLAQPASSGLNLAALTAEGLLTVPPANPTLSVPDDGTGASPAALAWMHVNCGVSCHTGESTGTAYGSGLRLRIGFDELAGKPVSEWEIAKQTVGVPVRSTKFAGDQRIVPGDPTSSLVYKLLSQRGSSQMPPIATNVVDESGRAAVEAWIRALPKPN